MPGGGLGNAGKKLQKEVKNRPIVVEMALKDSIGDQGKWDALDVNAKLDLTRKILLHLIKQDDANTEALGTLLANKDGLKNLLAAFGTDGNEIELKKKTDRCTWR